MSNTKQSKIETAAPGAPSVHDGMTVDSVLRDSSGTPRGFFRGEHLTLRPVLRGDLPGLAAMLAEDPLPGQSGPWTLARLESKFDDKKSPGFWTESGYHCFVGIGADGQLCGYVTEQERGAATYIVHHWLAEEHPQRRTAGIELVQLHTRWLTDWHAARGINTRILAGSTQQEEWLTASDFAMTYETPPHAWHLGELRPVRHFSWLSAELRAMPPHSTGEPESSAAVEPILDW